VRANDSADRCAILPAVGCTKLTAVNSAVITTIDSAIDSAVVQPDRSAKRATKWGAIIAALVKS
jgi:hypothetical protein